MGVYDTLVSNGDKVMATDEEGNELGRWERSPTIFGRSVRSATHWKGHWPAARGEVEDGNGFWERQPAKHTEEEERITQSEFRESQQEWVDQGRVEVEEIWTDYTITGEARILMKILDTSERLERVFPYQPPWTK